MTLAPGRVGESPNRVGGIGRVTGAQRVPRRPPRRGRAPREARHARRRRGRGSSAIDASRRPRPARRPPRPDRRRPAAARAALRAAARGPARCSRPARRSTTASRSRSSSRRRGTSRERAAALVRVEHEPLPAVFTRRRRARAGRAARPGPVAAAGRPAGGAPTSSTSTASTGATSTPRPPAPTLVVEAPYRFPMVTQFAIEPHAFMAAPDGDGLVVWSTIQHPNWLQRVIAGMVGHAAVAGSASIAPDPGGGFGGKQHAKYEPARRVRGAPARPARAARPDASRRRSRPSAAPRARRHVRIGFDARRRGSCSRTSRRTTSSAPTRTSPTGSWARARTRAPGRTTCRRCGSSPGRVLSHTVPVDRVPRLRQPAGQLGGRVDARRGRAARWASTASSSGCATSPHAATGSSRSTRRATATGRRPSGWPRSAIGWGEPLPEGHGRGIAVGIKSGPTTGLATSIVRLLVDGSVVVYAGTSDMGQGARTVLAQVARARARRAARLGHGRHGRHRDRALRPADVGVAVDRPHGQRGARRPAATIQAQLARDGGAAPRRRRGGRHRRRTGVVRLPDGSELTPIEVLKPGLGRLGGELTGVGETRKDAEPDHPLGGAPAFFEFNCTVDRGVTSTRRPAT